MEIEIYFPGGKRVDAKLNNFTIETDQCVEDGGKGSAPEPFDLFLTSIGTCAGIYVLSFCEKRGIPFKDIRLIQKAFWSADDKRIEKITLDIELPDGFPSKYKKAVISAAKLCTVKKHLETPPEFSIQTL